MNTGKSCRHTIDRRLFEEEEEEERLRLPWEDSRRRRRRLPKERLYLVTR